MKFSVTIPTYKAQYLREAVESVVSQTYPDWELIIIDDCSPENLRTVVEPFLADSRISYFRNEGAFVLFFSELVKGFVGWGYWIAAPIFLAIPAFATAPALIIVGYMMLSSVADIDWRDVGESVPAFIALAWMPFTYSIANGIMFGMLSWVILKVCTGKTKEVTGIMWICFVLFAARILTLITG